MHLHYHITYKVPAGYRVIDSVPYTSEQAAERALTTLPFSKDEQPKVKAFRARWCLGMCDPQAQGGNHNA
jgi:hypothetical protein